MCHRAFSSPLAIPVSFPGLSYPVFKGIMKKGYKVPTPIQRKVCGRDACGSEGGDANSTRPSGLLTFQPSHLLSPLTLAEAP